MQSDIQIRLVISNLTLHVRGTLGVVPYLAFDSILEFQVHVVFLGKSIIESRKQLKPAVSSLRAESKIILDIELKR